MYSFLFTSCAAMLEMRGETTGLLGLGGDNWRYIDWDRIWAEKEDRVGVTFPITTRIPFPNSYRIHQGN